MTSRNEVGRLGSASNPMADNLDQLDKVDLLLGNQSSGLLMPPWDKR